MRYDEASGNESVMTEAANKDPLVLFMPSGKRGRFPVGTPVLEAARDMIAAPDLRAAVEEAVGGKLH